MKMNKYEDKLNFDLINAEAFNELKSNIQFMSSDSAHKKVGLLLQHISH